MEFIPDAAKEAKNHGLRGNPLLLLSLKTKNKINKPMAIKWLLMTDLCAIREASSCSREQLTQRPRAGQGAEWESLEHSVLMGCHHQIPFKIQGTGGLFVILGRVTLGEEDRGEDLEGVGREKNMIEIYQMRILQSNFKKKTKVVKLATKLIMGCWLLSGEPSKRVSWKHKESCKTSHWSRNIKYFKKQLLHLL